LSTSFAILLRSRLSGGRGQLGFLASPALIGLLIGLVLLISGPSMILAYMKLRNRNLGPTRR
jgi:hypothetical protein